MLFCLMGGIMSEEKYIFDEVIFSEEQIQSRIKEVGAQITNDFQSKQDDGIVVISILKGAAIFMADLVRAIDLKLQIDFMAASSYYDSTKSSGRLKIDKDINTNIVGKHVIIAEDIVDSGLTLEYITNLLKNKGAASVTVCSFLNKNIFKTDINVKYTCFDCPEKFIVGFGLDYMQTYRNLPYVTSLKKELED